MDICLRLLPQEEVQQSSRSLQFRGNNQEGFSGERYSFYYDWNTWQEICLNAGFEEIKHFYRPDGIPEEERPWLASVWRK